MVNYLSLRELLSAAGGRLFHKIGFPDFMKNKILCVLCVFAVKKIFISPKCYGFFKLFSAKEKNHG